MIGILCGLISFVTATVSFLYGTRIAWVCGKKCNFKETPAIRKQLLSMSIPAATALYLFGFLIVFSTLFDGFVSVLMPAITSAMLLSFLMVSLPMPELRRKPQLKEATFRVRKNLDMRSKAARGLAFGFNRSF